MVLRYLLLLFLASVTTGAKAQTSAARAHVPGTPAGVTAFVGVNVVPMDTERVLTNHTVLVEKGWITALGPASQVKVPAGAVRIDGQSQYLIPGLADMHAHLGGGGGLSELPSDDLVERRLWGWLVQGVTTIRNLDWISREAGTQALRFKARAAAGELWSPRIYTSGLWADNLLALNREEKTKPTEVAQYVAAYQAAGYDFIKVHGRESPETHDSLIATARRVGIPVVGHAPFRLPAGEDPLQWALRGLKSIEHLTGYHQHLYLKHVQSELPPKTSGDQMNNGLFLAAFLQHLDAAGPTIKAAAEATRRAGVWNCPTQAYVAGKSRSPEIAKYANQVTKALQDAGVGLLLGTDAIALNFTVHDELQALVGAGLTPYQALLTGTRNVAQYFGTLDSTGTVGVGKRADLVLLQGNPLADIHHTAPPVGVMLGGRWLPRALIDQGLAAVKARPVGTP